MKWMNRRQFLTVCGMSALAGCSARSERSTVETDWSMFGGDERNGGRVPGESSIRDVAPQWSTDIGDYPYTSPVVTGGSLFVHTSTGLLGIDVTDGDLEWRTETIGKPAGTPAVADGTVVSTDDKRFADDDTGAFVRAFDTETGTERWKISVGNDVVFSPTIADGVVYVRSSTRFHALSLETGRERWRLDGLPAFERPYRDVTKDIAPAVAEGVVYVPNPDGITAIQTEDGTRQWRADAKKVRAAPAVGDGTVYVSGVSSGVSAFDATSGTERWSWQETGCWTSPAVADGSVYATAGFDVVAFDATNGTETWRTPERGLRGDIYASPAVVGETVVVGSTSRTAVGLRTEGSFLGSDSGNSRWSYDGAGTRYSPAVASETIYIVTDMGELVALAKK